jgi:hypothetical protein
MANKHEHLHPALVEESAMDYNQHEQTYNGFVTAVKYGVLIMAVLVIILYFAIRP